MLRSILLLLSLIIFSCSKQGTEENIQLSPQGGKAHWTSSDFPFTVLVPNTVPTDVLDSINKNIKIINDVVGGTAMLISVVDPMDARLNGGVNYGDHTIVWEADRDGWRASTDLTYIKGPLGDKEGRLFSAETSLNNSTPRKFLDKVILHELLHNWGFSHSLSKSNIMYESAEVSTGQISDFEKEYMKKMFLGQLD